METIENKKTKESDESKLNSCDTLKLKACMFRVLTLKYKLDLEQPSSCTYILTFSRLLYITSHQNIVSFHMIPSAEVIYKLVCREKRKKNVSIQKRCIAQYINIHLYFSEYKPLHSTPFFNIFKGLLLIHESFESPPIYNKSPINPPLPPFSVFYTSHHNIVYIQTFNHSTHHT